MNNCPECGNATHCTRATKDLQKEISDLKELQDPDAWEKALELQAKLMNENKLCAERITQLQQTCGALTDEIDNAKALLAKYSDSPVAKDRTLMDALRNMLAAYVTNRDYIVEVESNLKHLQKRWAEAACPECHDFGCGGHSWLRWP